MVQKIDELESAPKKGGWVHGEAVQQAVRRGLPVRCSAWQDGIETSAIQFSRGECAGRRLGRAVSLHAGRDDMGAQRGEHLQLGKVRACMLSVQSRGGGGELLFGRAAGGLLGTLSAMCYISASCSAGNSLSAQNEAAPCRSLGAAVVADSTRADGDVRLSGGSGGGGDDSPAIT